MILRAPRAPLRYSILQYSDSEVLRSQVLRSQVLRAERLRSESLRAEGLSSFLFLYLGCTPNLLFFWCSVLSVVLCAVNLGGPFSTQCPFELGPLFALRYEKMAASSPPFNLHNTVLTFFFFW